MKILCLLSSLLWSIKLILKFKSLCLFEIKGIDDFKCCFFFLIKQFLSGSNVKQHQHDSGFHSVNSEIRRYHYIWEEREREEKDRLNWKKSILRKWNVSVICDRLIIMNKNNWKEWLPSTLQILFLKVTCLKDFI